MNRIFSIASIFVLTASVAGCDFLGDIVSGDKTYSGTVAFGFEVSAFSPCGSDTQWWIVGDDETYNDLYNQYQDLGLNPYEQAFAVLKGSKSGQGEYGHLGAYSREFDVDQVLEVRLLEEGECQ